MGHLPSLTSRKLLSILMRMDFVVLRQRGSHVRLMQTKDDFIAFL